MKMPNVLCNYWEFVLCAVLLVVFLPTTPSALAGLNWAIWWMLVLVVVNEINHTKQKVKKAKAYWMLELPSKNRRRFSIDQIAYLVFTVSVIVFFAWLVVFA